MGKTRNTRHFKSAYARHTPCTVNGKADNVSKIPTPMPHRRTRQNSAEHIPALTNLALMLMTLAKIGSGKVDAT